MRRIASHIASGFAAGAMIVVAGELAEDFCEDTNHFPMIPRSLLPLFWLVVVFLAGCEARKAARIVE